jgi:DNA-binding NarL/FixJ family response regulator
MESRLAREGLGRILRKFQDVLVVGETGQPEAAKQHIHESKCHVLVRDTFDPYWISDCLQSESSPRPGFKTLLIGMENDAEQFLLAARSGVTGYLLKDASAADIVLAIRALARGEAHCPPQLCLRLFQYAAQQDTTVPAEPKLACPSITLRQEKLVNLVAKGLTNKEIAFQLGLSEFTVKNHMQRIMRRLKVANRREVVDTVRIRERQFLQPGFGRKALSESTIGATR